MFDKKDKRFDDVVYRVEANSFEYISLWKENDNLPEGHHMKVKWEEDAPGFWKEIGRLAGYPICVECFFTKLNGKRVVFFDPTSRVVDWDIVQKWVKEQCPEGTPKCDAMNFGHCINEVLKD